MMKTAFVKIVLITSCYCLTVETVVAASRAPSGKRIHLNNRRAPLVSSFVSPCRRDRAHCFRRTKTFAATVINPSLEDGKRSVSPGKKSVPRSHPNWRDVDVHGEEAGAVSCSPFCHLLSRDSHNGVAAAAPWTGAAHRSALDLYERMRSCTDPYIAPVLKSALDDMEMAYRLYGPFCMVGSYNGGKDAVVIFHLMRAAHARYCSDRQKVDAHCIIPRPRVIYFQRASEFPEILSLLDETVEEFDVDMLAFTQDVSFGDGLKYLVDRNISPWKDGISPLGSKSTLPPPHPLAFVLGTRKGDPNAGSQGVYAPSSSYMPPFLRVNPILDWTYGHVWHFLRCFELPYCSLYDDGYTSLGTVNDTLPCPALRKSSESQEYWPAYMLKDWDLERAGRIDKKKVGEETKLKEANKAELVKSESADPSGSTRPSDVPQIRPDDMNNSFADDTPPSIEIQEIDQTHPKDRWYSKQ